MYCQKNNCVFSSLFTDETRILHGYSTKKQGDMREKKSQQILLDLLGLQKRTLVQPQQIHSNRVIFLSTVSDYIPHCDGVICKKNTSIALGVRGADCVPIIFFDAAAEIIGVAHAGWKGTIQCISQVVIRLMVEYGASIKNINVSIGPRIGRCCYSIAQERANLFTNKFGNNERIVSVNQNKYYLDLGYTNYYQLIAMGVSDLRIDITPMCTQCQSDTFFSYRREGISNFSEQMGIIALNDT